MIQQKIQSPKLVLVVDDQEINRDILGAILEKDYQILYAENGLEALRIMREHEDLSIVLLDLQMPVMNGYEVMDAALLDEQLQKIPIIVLTADKSAEVRALRMGAYDFITKPLDFPEVVLARVDRIIELSQGRQLISAAERDPLTSLYDKNFFYEYANRLFLYHPDMHLDAVVINIDQFHSVNALHGRQFGDEILKTIGREIRAFLAGKEGIAGRCSGDTFNIYCLPQKDYGEMLEHFQRILSGMSPNISIHLRMGVRPYEKGVEPHLLFDCANAACNRARGDFQKPLVLYDEAMHQQELLNQRLLNDLRTAIEKRQLLVYYQPQYNIQCEPPRLVGAEALVRWRHPELGMVSPGMFVPLLEGNGLIGVVDACVWEEAARQVSEWKDRYGITLPVSVNLSRTEISDPTLSERLLSLVRQNGLEHRDLKLEVTESAYTNNTKQILGVVRGLQESGFEIEMDDFGSGYSALNMLSDMPLDVLKMDMKFIRNIENSAKDRQLVGIIFNIAKCLGALVTVEGIETKGQLEILKKGGCDIGQGYYFSPPIPAERFEKLIEKELSTERS